jgi:hypothetical protein
MTLSEIAIKGNGPMRQCKIPRLSSGGLITSYYCTSTCRHCLYACSPKWEKQYIDKESAIQLMGKIKAAGCRSIHIGGGEPFLNFDGLLDVVKGAGEVGMGIDYIETNSSWYTDEQEVTGKLRLLMKHEVGQLLISISPFHNEFIPFVKVKRLMEACRNCHMGVFPWVMDFYRDVDSFDEATTHSLEEYGEAFGSHYAGELPQRYWTHFGGRAVQWYKNILPLCPLDQIVKTAPCREMTDTSHFHADLSGNYIPGLCAGLAVRMDEVGQPLDPERYPLLTMLCNSGIAALLEHARNEYAFKPAERYLNKCHLCNDIRLFLVTEKKVDTHELQPREYYSQVRL